MKSVTKRSVLAAAILALGFCFTSPLIGAELPKGPQAGGPQAGGPQGGSPAGAKPGGSAVQIKELKDRPAKPGETQEKYNARIKAEDDAKKAQETAKSSKQGGNAVGGGKPK